jgi:predicted N-acetyltransferase YhbS
MEPTEPAPRAATRDERPQVIAAAGRVFEAPRAHEGEDMGTAYPLLFGADNADGLRVVVSPRGELLAHAGIYVRDAVLGDRRTRVGCLGAVFTTPAARGRGLASAVVAEALGLARARGAGLVLVSGWRGLYARAGFRPYPPVRRVLVPRSPGPAATDARPGDLEALAALHRQEAVRVDRPSQDWDRLFAARVALWGPGQWRVARDQRSAIGYAVLQAHPRGPRVIELGGDREAMLAALAADGPFELLVPPADTTTAAVVARHGWPVEALTLPLGAIALEPALEDVTLPWFGLNYV